MFFESKLTILCRDIVAEKPEVINLPSEARFCFDLSVRHLVYVCLSHDYGLTFLPMFIKLGINVVGTRTE